ncbi:ribbon-helix-helix domain-containing protein [Rhodoplanes roseus]|uniref:ribbon-helix-helix domain-containing protein n=1 Tax=Rhodoplanes roseus TaxID=29409 RepID=UPI0011B7E737|nr:type II toxin-antitoxin system ParD family antitoxin [Rhodoplanes roseus]
MTVTLSDELARLVEERVGSGAYMDESAVVSDGLRALQAQDTTIERWLCDEVGPTYDRVRGGTEPLIPADEVLADLEIRCRHRKDQGP